MALSSTLTVASLSWAKRTRPSNSKRPHFYLSADNNWLSFARTSWFSPISSFGLGLSCHFRFGQAWCLPWLGHGRHLTNHCEASYAFFSITSISLSSHGFFAQLENSGPFWVELASLSQVAVILGTATEKPRSSAFAPLDSRRCADWRSGASLHCYWQPSVRRRGFDQSHQLLAILFFLIRLRNLFDALENKWRRYSMN